MFHNIPRRFYSQYLRCPYSRAKRWERYDFFNGFKFGYSLFVSAGSGWRLLGELAWRAQRQGQRPTPHRPKHRCCQPEYYTLLVPALPAQHTELYFIFHSHGAVVLVETYCASIILGRTPNHSAPVTDTDARTH